MAGRRGYVSNEYYRLPPIGETVPVDVTRRYRTDREGFPGYGPDWTAPELQRTPHSSFSDNKRLFSHQKFVPSVVDRLAPDHLSTSVRGMGMINPQINRARDIRMRREDIPARFCSYPAPRFSQIPTAFLSQSFPTDGGQFADDYGHDDRRFARPFTYNTRPASPRPYRQDRVQAESQSDPFYPLDAGNGCTSRLPPLGLPGANRSLDRLVQNCDNFGYSRNKGRPKVKDPLSCKCCQDINKINLYNQRLGRATRYPLQATVPQIEKKMAARRQEKNRQKHSLCTFADRRDSEEDALDKLF